MVWVWAVGLVVWFLLAGAVAVALGRGVRLADHRSTGSAAAGWTHDGPVTVPRERVPVAATGA